MDTKCAGLQSVEWTARLQTRFVTRSQDAGPETRGACVLARMTFQICAAMGREVKPELLGVDVGGVLVDRIRADGSDTSFFSDRFLETPAVEGAFDTLARLARERFGQRICIVSKCGPRVEEKTRLWLAHHQVLDTLGLDARALHFCRERRDKGPICKRLKVTHFIDDRMDVLAYLTSVPHRFLFGPQKAGVNADGVTRAENWAEMAKALL